MRTTGCVSQMHDPVLMGMVGDPGQVVLGRRGEATATFGTPAVAADRSGVQIPIRLAAAGVEAATTLELGSWSGGSRRLVEFFAELSGAWKGWTGAKEWRDDGANVSMSATHDGVGLVNLEIRFNPFQASPGPGSWKLAVRVPVEPGSLSDAVARLEALLEGAP